MPRAEHPCPGRQRLLPVGSNDDRSNCTRLLHEKGGGSGTRSTCEGDAASSIGTGTRFRGGIKAKPSSTNHEGKAASTKTCTSRRGKPRCDGSTEHFISKSTPASRHTAHRAGLHAHLACTSPHAW
mmetsp:Transcript_28093/g.38475  ORF Transcript_28093/g.38475 Transcript_28093/m.38475 type:complete len:126 (+) Transcript_28093:293-670(+)